MSPRRGVLMGRNLQAWCHDNDQAARRTCQLCLKKKRDTALWLIRKPSDAKGKNVVLEVCRPCQQPWMVLR